MIEKRKLNGQDIIREYRRFQNINPEHVDEFAKTFDPDKMERFLV